MTGHDPRALIEALIEQLKTGGSIRSEQVEAAFRATPRHLFLPDVPLERVYRNTHIEVEGVDGSGHTVSSQPSIMAIMLEQLDPRPGHRVLEIGAGTGYNAALMGRLVGPAGQVVSIDLDAAAVGRARRHVAAAGIGNVTLLCADGALGYEPAAPYDRIILTVASRDLAPAWREQLRRSGRLVLPLELARSQQHIVCLQWQGDHLRSVLPTVACGFVDLRGMLGLRSFPLHTEPGLTLWIEGPGGILESTIAAALIGEGPRDILPTAVWIWPGQVGGLRTRLELHEASPAALIAEQAWADRATIPRLSGTPGRIAASIGVLSPDGMAWLTASENRTPTAPNEHEQIRLAIWRYGKADHTAQRLHDQVTAWDAAGRPCRYPALRSVKVYPRSAGAFATSGDSVLHRAHTDLVAEWQEAPE